MWQLADSQVDTAEVDSYAISYKGAMIHTVKRQTLIRIIAYL
jgi:hypothetical protein